MIVDQFMFITMVIFCAAWLISGIVAIIAKDTEVMLCPLIFSIIWMLCSGGIK